MSKDKYSLESINKRQQAFFKEMFKTKKKEIQNLDIIISASKSGSGSKPKGSKSGSGSSSTSDPCAIGDGTPVDASELCNKIAKIEGNGTYTQQNAARFSAAAGRYQFMGATATGVIKQMGKASNDAQARALWSKCRTSNSQECKSLQDQMCNYYANQLRNQLKKYGIKPTMRNMYLAWNQGAYGAKLILEAAKNGTNVTHSKVAHNMHNQAWTKTSNGQAFLAGMENYMRKRGVQA